MSECESQPSFSEQLLLLSIFIVVSTLVVSVMTLGDFGRPVAFVVVVVLRVAVVGVY